MNWKRFLGNYEAKMEEAILAGDLVEASRIRGKRKKMLRKRLFADERSVFRKSRRAGKPLVTEEE